MLNQIIKRLLVIGVLVVLSVSGLYWLVTDLAHAEPNVTLTVCPSGPPACQFSSVQAAVDSVPFSANVLIAQGIYTDIQARARQDVTTTGLVSQIVYINDKYITLQGGYAVTDFVHSYPITQPTILDAQGRGRVIYAAHNANVTVEGVYIRHGNTGYAFGSDGISAAGGGIAAFNSTMTLRNNHIEDNHIFIWGGGVFLQDTTSILEGNSFLLNSTGGRGSSGGALSIFGGTSLISANQFISNTSWSGGGLDLGSVTATVQANTFISNNVATNGGGLQINLSEVSMKNNEVRGNSSGAAYGPIGNGGISVQQSTITLTGNLITNNMIEESINGQLGAAGAGLQIMASNAYLDYNTISNNGTSGPNSPNTVFVAGGGLYASNSTLKLNHNTIANNGASAGGGIYIAGSTALTLPSVLLDANSIVGNRSYYGAGIFLEAPSSTRIVNTVIADNQIVSMPITASYLFYPRPTEDPTGSAVFLLGSTVQILHGTIDHNTGGNGNAIAGTGSIALTNTILVRHDVGINLPLGYTATLQSVLWGNTRNISGSATIIANNNVFGDPGFVNAAAHDYHLQPGSIAIDRGATTDVFTDIDGQPRPIGPKPDLGVDEFLAVPPTATPSPTPRPTITATPTKTPSPTGSPTASPTQSPTPQTAQSSLTIKLAAQPHSRQNFRFHSPIGLFKLDDAVPDDGDNVSAAKQLSLPPGTHVFTAEVPYSWSLINIQCDVDHALTANLATGQFSVQMQAGQNVACTVTMARSAHILARVWEDKNGNGSPANGEPYLSGWRIGLYAQSTPFPPTQIITSNQRGQANFTNQPPIRYKTCEQLQTGWRNTRPTTLDDSGQPCYWLTVEPGKTLTLWFGNQQTSGHGLTPLATDGDPVFADRPDVPFDEAGYDGNVYDDTEIYTVYLPMMMR